MLSLLHNEVVSKQYYRLYMINLVPSLKQLDFQKVTVKVSLAVCFGSEREGGGGAGGGPEACAGGGATGTAVEIEVGFAKKDVKKDVPVWCVRVFLFVGIRKVKFHRK